LEQPLTPLIPIMFRDGESSSCSVVSDSRVEVVFPALGLILNELFQLFNDKSNENERNSAIIDYMILIIFDILE